MRIGVSFPTVEIGADLAGVCDFVHTAEELGYTQVPLNHGDYYFAASGRVVSAL